MGHAADKGDIQKQTVRSDWCGQSSTQKMEEEALQKNEADEIGRVGALRSLPPSYAAGVP